MKIIRILLGLLCIILATVPPYLLYTRHEVRTPGLLRAMLIASVTCFAVFSLTKKLPSFMSQLIAGIIGSYIALIGLVFFRAAIIGEIAETIMWSPIIVLFGIPFMAPLVGLSWLSSTLIFGMKKK